MTEIMSESGEIIEQNSSLIAESSFEPYYTEEDIDGIITRNIKKVMNESTNAVLAEDGQTVFFKHGDQVLFTDRDTYITETVKNYSFSEAYKANNDNNEIQKEAKRLFMLGKAMMSKQLRAALESTKNKQTGFDTGREIEICEISYEDYCYANNFSQDQEERIFEEMEAEVAQLAKKLNAKSKFTVGHFELDNVFTIHIKKGNSYNESNELNSDDDEILAEGLGTWMTNKKIKRVERQLEEAIAERKRMDERFKNKKTVAVTVRDESTGTSYDFASGSPKMTRTYTDRTVYRDVEDVKSDQDDKIADLKEELERLRKKLSKNESCELNEGLFFKSKEQKKLERQQREEARQKAWNDRIKESNRLRSMFNSKIPVEIKKYSRGKMFAADIFVFELPYELSDEEFRAAHKKIDDLQAEMQKVSKFKIDVGAENNNVIIDVEELLNESNIDISEGFSFNMFKNKKINNKSMSPAEKKEKQLEAQKEAERLFPKAKAMFGPALNKGFNNDAASDHLIGDIGGNDVTIVCVGFSDFQNAELDDDPEFVKLLDKAEAEMKNIVQKLQTETDFKVGWFEDDFNYFLTIDIKK